MQKADSHPSLDNSISKMDNTNEDVMDPENSTFKETKLKVKGA